MVKNLSVASVCKMNLCILRLKACSTVAIIAACRFVSGAIGQVSYTRAGKLGSPDSNTWLAGDARKPRSQMMIICWDPQRVLWPGRPSNWSSQPSEVAET